ncbi:MAG: hypothetical protein QOG13_3018 [Sphingomonadales bacterium]|jgi:hypothetical protein|nr:hypothetical protein [Sphingomonadales bacterium]
MTNPWPKRIAEAGVVVSMVMLLGGLSQEAGPWPIMATTAAVGLLLFGFLLIVVGRSGS